MLKNPLRFVKICDQITWYTIYTLVFLVPVFFAAWTSDALDFNKQALLVLLVFISLFAWMLKTLVSGRFLFNVNKVHIVAGIAFLIYLASTVFSVSRYGSFWGQSQAISAGFLSVTCFFILYFLVSNNATTKESAHFLKLVMLSSLLVFAYGILQLFGLHIFSFGFAKNNSFNTVGSLAHLGTFAAVLLPLFIASFAVLKKWWKLLCLADIVLILVLLLLINYGIMWWTAALGCAVIMFFWIIKRHIFDGRWMFLPMFFLVVSLFFIIFSPQIKWLPQKSLEVRLTHKASFDIGVKTFKSSALLGSGPGTFAYDFAKYKDVDFNKSPVWNVNLHAGSSKALTDAATLGILGFLALIVLAGFVIFYAARHLITFLVVQKSDQAIGELSLALGFLAMFVSGTLAYFLTTTNISLDFIYFLAIGILTALVFKDNRQYILKSSSLLNLMVAFIFTVVFVFGAGLLMLQGQRYFADMQYNKALDSWQAGRQEESLKYLKIAASNNTKLDAYFNQLALFSLVHLQSKVLGLDLNALAAEDKKNIQSLVSDSVNASNIAVKLGSQNVDNWSMKGYICQNLIGFLSDALDCSVASYDKALQLSPASPYLLLQQGNAYLTAVVNSNLSADGQTQNSAQLSLKAKEKFNNAIALKEDYALAYIQLALVGKLQNNNSEMAMAMENAIRYSKNNAELALQIGLIYYQDKNWAKAQQEFSRALSIVPNYANAMYYLGLAYDDQGEKSNALAQFTKLLESNPNNENVKKIIANLRAGRVALDGLAVQPPAPVEPVAPTPSSTIQNP